MLHVQKIKYSFLHGTLLFFHLLVFLAVSCKQSDSWSRRVDMPTPRGALSTCVVDGKIYAIGGYPRANVEGLQTVEVYEPSTNEWTARAPMPTGRRALSASVVNGKIYAIGGMLTVTPPHQTVSTVGVYTPVPGRIVP